jgi:hypothetical protein
MRLANYLLSLYAARRAARRQSVRVSGPLIVVGDTEVRQEEPMA